MEREREYRGMKEEFMGIHVGIHVGIYYGCTEGIKRYVARIWGK